MRKVINLALVLLTCIFAYWLYASIREPIAFAEIRDTRKDAVVSVLKKLQISQDLYRTIKGEFADNFDSLAYVLNNGRVPIIKLESDPSDPTNQDKFIKTVTYKPAKDSLYSLLGSRFSIDSLKYIPYTDGKMFSIDADTLTYQSTVVNVVEIGTYYKDFMGEYADPRFKKYDSYYNPDKALKFGDMTSPNTNGNW